MERFENRIRALRSKTKRPNNNKRKKREAIRNSCVPRDRGRKALCRTRQRQRLALYPAVLIKAVSSPFWASTTGRFWKSIFGSLPRLEYNHYIVVPQKHIVSSFSLRSSVQIRQIRHPLIKVINKNLLSARRRLFRVYIIFRKIIFRSISTR